MNIKRIFRNLFDQLTANNTALRQPTGDTGKWVYT